MFLPFECLYPRRALYVDDVLESKVQKGKYIPRKDIALILFLITLGHKTLPLTYLETQSRAIFSLIANGTIPPGSIVFLSISEEATFVDPQKGQLVETTTESTIWLGGLWETTDATGTNMEFGTSENHTQWRKFQTKTLKKLGD